jgi:hypothetical protein
MQQIIVVLEDNKESWQVIYTAYEIAARTGSNLIGAIISGTKSSDPDQRLEREFETGARAAGVRSKINTFSSLDQLIAFPDERDALFVSRASLTEQKALDQIMALMPCPLWIIPSQRSIRNILVLLDGIEKNSPALSLALSLARRQQTPLIFIGTGAGVPSDVEISELDMVRLNETNIDLDFVLKELKTNLVDLVFVSWPWENFHLWSAIQKSECVFALAPLFSSI